MDGEGAGGSRGDATRRRAVRAGLSAALVWFLIELAIRGVAGFVVLEAILTATETREPAPGHFGALGFGLLVPAMLMLWVVFDRRIRQDRLSPLALGYRFTWAAGVTGVVCGGVDLFGVLWLTDKIDTQFFGPSNKSVLTWIAAAPMWAILALLLGNGILAPIVEELAWRGYIQSRLSLGWGSGVGLVATALLFSAKHVVLDVSLSRTATLVIGSLFLGVIRHRWGTFASTLAHFVGNFTATTLGVIEALTR